MAEAERLARARGGERCAVIHGHHRVRAILTRAGERGEVDEDGVGAAHAEGPELVAPAVEVVLESNPHAGGADGGHATVPVLVRQARHEVAGGRGQEDHFAGLEAVRSAVVVRVEDAAKDATAEEPGGAGQGDLFRGRLADGLAGEGQEGVRHHPTHRLARGFRGERHVAFAAERARDERGGGAGDRCRRGAQLLLTRRPRRRVERLSLVTATSPAPTQQYVHSVAREEFPKTSAR